MKWFLSAATGAVLGVLLTMLALIFLPIIRSGMSYPEMARRVEQLSAGGDLGVPVGAIIPYFGAETPEQLAARGWLLCDGRPIPETDRFAPIRRMMLEARNEYHESVISAGGTIRTPDLRGMFLRGLNDGQTDERRADPEAGRTLGHFQADNFMAHSHQINRFDAAQNAYGGPHVSGFGKEPVPESTSIVGGLETRPKNVAVRFIIRAF